MARHDERDRIRAIRHTHRPHGYGTAHRARDIRVATTVPIRNLEQPRPDVLLERRSTKVERNIEVGSAALEILQNLLDHALIGPDVIATFRARRAPLQPRTKTTSARVWKFEVRLTQFSGCDAERTDRRTRLGNMDSFHTRATITGRRETCEKTRAQTRSNEASIADPIATGDAEYIGSHALRGCNVAVVYLRFSRFIIF